MQHNEFKECVIEYIKADNYISFINLNNIEIEYFKKILYGVRFRDNPDGFYNEGGKLFLLEHFQYDSSFAGKKGSKTFIEKAAFLSKIKHDIANNAFICKSKILPVDNSLNYMVLNFKQQLQKHIKRIDQYKFQLEKEGILKNQKVVIIFCCEEKSIFGDFIDDDQQGPIPFSIFNIDEAFNLIVNSNIDYFVFFNTYDKTLISYILKPSGDLKNKIKIWKKTDAEMIKFKPAVIGCTFKVNKIHLH